MKEADEARTGRDRPWLDPMKRPTKTMVTLVSGCLYAWSGVQQIGAATIAFVPCRCAGDRLQEAGQIAKSICRASV